MALQIFYTYTILPSLSLVPGVSMIVIHFPTPRYWSVTYEIFSVFENALWPTANDFLSPISWLPKLDLPTPVNKKIFRLYYNCIYLSEKWPAGPGPNAKTETFGPNICFLTKKITKSHLKSTKKVKN